MKITSFSNILSITFLACSLLLTSPTYAYLMIENLVPTINTEPEAVDLASYVKQVTSTFKGQKKLIDPKNILFLGKLKALPEQKKAGYLYSAIDMLEIRPYPHIQHQMFIEADDGEVIAVYVDIRIVKAIELMLKPGQEALWHGYHVYNYKRGPAIVIENVEVIEGKEK